MDHPISFRQTTIRLKQHGVLKYPLRRPPSEGIPVSAYHYIDLFYNYFSQISSTN